MPTGQRCGRVAAPGGQGSRKKMRFVGKLGEKVLLCTNIIYKYSQCLYCIYILNIMYV